MSNDTPPVTDAASPPERTSRISPFRVVLLGGVTLAVVAGIVALAKPVVAPAATPGPTGFAAYVDVTATPTYPFETPLGPTQQDVILSFVVASPDEPCTPTWGGYYDLDQAATDLELDRRLAQLRKTGGNARVSFGGQANRELATACADIDALTSAYQSVVDRYELSSIDLDIEGDALTDAEGMARRATAIATVQESSAAANRPVAVWLTLPVDTNGLTSQGVQAVTTMLDAGVDVAGVNGMTMNFGGTKDRSESMADAVMAAATALQGQVQAAFAQSGRTLDETAAWGRVGITPMIGQNDVAGEVFTIADAEVVNDFARTQGVGLLSMWSANRDSTCRRPLPAVLTVVQDSCSGVDQEGFTFTDVLGDATDEVSPSTSPSASATPTAQADSPVIVDDPATSPFPIWEPLGTYPSGSKVVWKKQVYQAKYWTSGVDPTTPVASEYDMPWTLLGPVLPGDTPAPLPTLPSNTYVQWDSDTAYVEGTRVQVGDVPYEAKWWTQGQEPGRAISGGSPWLLVYPAQ